MIASSSLPNKHTEEERESLIRVNSLKGEIEKLKQEIKRLSVEKDKDKQINDELLLQIKISEDELGALKEINEKVYKELGESETELYNSNEQLKNIKNSIVDFELKLKKIQDDAKEIFENEKKSQNEILRKLCDAALFKKKELVGIETDMEQKRTMSETFVVESNRLEASIVTNNNQILSQQNEVEKYNQIILKLKLSQANEQNKINQKVEEAHWLDVLIVEKHDKLKKITVDVNKVQVELDTSNTKMLNNIQREQRLEVLSEKVKEICAQAGIQFTL